MKNSCLPVALKSLTDPSDAKDAAKELERFVVKCLAPNADVSTIHALHLPRLLKSVMFDCRCMTSLEHCVPLYLMTRKAI
jgi:hypothetical protein